MLCLESVHALTADAFGMLLLVAHKLADHVKPHLKTPRTNRAPPTFVVPQRTCPQTPQAAADAGKNET